MKDQDFGSEVSRILEEAPEAQRALRENHSNLLKVADYCYGNYVQAGGGSLAALEETKSFTTQSLASVAYQVSSLAGSVLRLLDAQANQMRRMESSIHLIGQTLDMHKEKVSRRDIGAFTAVRRVPRGHKVVPPATRQPRPPYSRRPISFQQLDGLGHGVKVSGKQADRAGSIRKPGSSFRAPRPEPVQCPTAPPPGGSSFGKPVAPPTTPPTWPAPSECDIITTLLDEAPPPPHWRRTSVHLRRRRRPRPPPPPPPPADPAGGLPPPTTAAPPPPRGSDQSERSAAAPGADDPPQPGNR
ncbi:ABI family, member 3a [Menidia menidia]